ncbi:hypothetical protein PRZ48_012468 [Zasmidium cellare]|uniref:Uncharacterized protein n=1 Tax=Zasmidium cellare TaxID=395010 RepID=A0ABR0E4Y5_ZASCE|nr:hypothetical protein PRZ48_012468 [Zasmidium cellare]
MVTFVAGLTLLASLGHIVNVAAQCSNNVAVYNPDLRTMTANQSYFIVPVPKAAVQTAINEAYPLMNLSLLDVPTSDKSLFPSGFPAGMHPVVAVQQYDDDIRMSALQIDGPLIAGIVLALYVSKDGSKSPLSVSTDQYIAGKNGPLPNGLAPALASTLLFAGAPVRLGEFRPQDAAWLSEGDGLFSAQSKWALVPNPISGPAVYPEAADLEFRTIAAAQSKYTAKTFRYVLNQPLLLPSGQCQRNSYYFNNATAVPVFRRGQVTLGPAADGANPVSGVLQKASPDGSGVYANVDGYSVCAQNVGHSPEDCDAAVANVNPDIYS